VGAALALGVATGLARADEPTVDFVVRSAGTLIQLSQSVLVKCSSVASKAITTFPS